MTPFSLWLQIYIEENNLSQADLCRKTGFDDATINEHFRGVQSPSRKNIAVYAKAFNLPIDYINEITELYIDQGELITGRDKISRLYKALSLYNKKKLIAYADKLLTEQEKTALTNL
ncbi:helix-turn-helix domain-containing protein [Pelosinus fermentans]|uniref:Helix-turn-helix domain protein n=2 Tax=Pelosinus fermentans JBW45 TaxID=1192197 RepID=I9DFS9_9FIRM|nr:helix-turn-helix transcriptional regulator [Pelosinus fermentans]AJQ27529.1 helix-turn-helix domain protein [Pelosinus fermentans JBW45]